MTDLDLCLAVVSRSRQSSTIDRGLVPKDHQYRKWHMEPPKNYILSLKIIDLALHNQIYFSISGLESISVAQLVCVHQD